MTDAIVFISVECPIATEYTLSREWKGDCQQCTDLSVTWFDMMTYQDLFARMYERSDPAVKEIDIFTISPLVLCLKDIDIGPYLKFHMLREKRFRHLLIVNIAEIYIDLIDRVKIDALVSVHPMFPESNHIRSFLINRYPDIKKQVFKRDDYIIKYHLKLPQRPAEITAKMNLLKTELEGLCDVARILPDLKFLEYIPTKKYYGDEKMKDLILPTCVVCDGDKTSSCQLTRLLDRELIMKRNFSSRSTGTCVSKNATDFAECQSKFEKENQKYSYQESEFCQFIQPLFKPFAICQEVRFMILNDEIVGVVPDIDMSSNINMSYFIDNFDIRHFTINENIVKILRKVTEHLRTISPNYVFARVDLVIDCERDKPEEFAKWATWKAGLRGKPKRWTPHHWVYWSLFNPSKNERIHVNEIEPIDCGHKGYAWDLQVQDEKLQLKRPIAQTTFDQILHFLLKQVKTMTGADNGTKYLQKYLRYKSRYIQLRHRS
jgi:hypothetical protein